MKKYIPVIVTIIIVILLIGTYYLYNFTNVFGNKVIPTKISSCVINYIPGLNEQVLDKDGKEIITLEEVKLDDNSLKEISKKLRVVNKKDGKIKDNAYIATIVINKDYKLFIGENNGYVEYNNKKNNVSIPNSLYNYIYDLIKENDSKLFKELTYKDITIHGDGSKILVSNEKNISAIKDKLKYYNITLEDDFVIYNGGYKYTLKLDDVTTILLYDNNVGYLDIGNQDSLNGYVVFKNGLYDIINEIYNISSNANNEDEQKESND